MAQARLMTQEADYKRLGLKRNEIEMWEDGERDDGKRLMTGWIERMP